MDPLLDLEGLARLRNRSAKTTLRDLYRNLNLVRSRLQLRSPDMSRRDAGMPVSLDGYLDARAGIFGMPR